MHTLAIHPSSRPSLTEDGFAPPIPVLPMQLGNREHNETFLSQLPAPEPARDEGKIWLDDPSYDTAAFLGGL